MALHRRVAPGFSTEPIERIPKTPDTIFRTMVGVAQHALQEPRHSQQHDDGLNPNGDQATLPLPIGHPTPRQNGACATRLALRTPDVLHARVCHNAAVCTSQVLGTSVRHALHQPGQYRVLAGHVAIEFTLQSQHMFRSKLLNKLNRICSQSRCFPTHGGARWLARHLF